MEKCSNWFCARSTNNSNNNNNYTGNNNEASNAPTNTNTKTTTNGVFSSSKAGTSGSPSVTFYDAVTNMENGTVATVLMSPKATTASTCITASIPTPTTPTTASSTSAAAPSSSTTTTTAAATLSSISNAATSASAAMTCNGTTSPTSTSTASPATGSKPKQVNYEEITQEPGPSPSSGSTTCDETEPPSKNCYRLVMLGSSRTGKTSLVQRFLGQKFDESYTPTIEDFHRKLYRIRSEVYQLDILDTSGNHPFPAMRRLSFLTGDIFVLVFSMDSRESFEEVVRLREQILETKWSALAASSGRSKKHLPRVPMVIAGNKCDRDMKTVQIDEVMGYIAGQDSACVFVECSAKKNFRVEDLFYELFMAANLPQEMAPNHHRWVKTAFGAPSALPAHCPTSRTKKCTLSIKRRLSDACGVVAPNVRRPSIRTDLMLMRAKTCSLSDAEATGSGRSGSTCVIM